MWQEVTKVYGEIAKITLRHLPILAGKPIYVYVLYDYQCRIVMSIRPRPSSYRGIHRRVLHEVMKHIYY